MNLQSGLLRKYLLTLVGLVSLSLIGAGAAMVVISSQEQQRSAESLLTAEARTAAAHVDVFFERVTSALGWGQDYDTAGQDILLREQLHHLLQQSPPIIELRVVDDFDTVRLRVSRTEVDCWNPCANHDLDDEDRRLLRQAVRERQAAFGKVHFERDAMPLMHVAVAGRISSSGVLLAEIDLRQIQSTISALHIGHSGYVQLVDDQGQLVAHPDPSLVLRHLDIHAVLAARADLSAMHGGAVMANALGGGKVLRAVAPVASMNWWVYAEQPVEEAFEPVVKLIRALALAMLTALMIAVGLSYLLARRMARPILALRSGAAHLASGQLDTRIKVVTGDEVELLADEFNRMAAALASSHVELEQRVDDRTRELAVASRQLKEQADTLAGANSALSRHADELALRGDQLERANAAKTRFLAAASHDLLQPMHAVGLLVGILGQQPEGNRDHSLIDKLQGAVHGMTNLFIGLLDISKLDAQQVGVEPRTIALRQLFAFLEARYQPLAAEKGLALRVRVSDVAVSTDPVLLERIVGNLLSNAIRYTRRGGVLLACRPVGNEVRVLVYDTGVGIAADDHEKIFDEFVQIGRVERDRNQGLGLGLAIVKRCAGLLGRSMTLRSLPGRGSVFGIQLPRACQNEPGIAHERLDYYAGQALAGAFVVLIDDDDGRYALEQVFQACSCHVLSASTAQNAIGQLAQHLRLPDLIVTDWRLAAEESGLDVILAIRAHTGESTPALVLTADAHPPDIATLPERCMVASKPSSATRVFELCAALQALPASSTPSE